MSFDEDSIQQHYGSEGLLERILAGLKAAGKNPAAPTPADLAPADEFHSLGRVATRDLAEFAALRPGTRVLDVGSGLGGPARFLASECGCDVTGVDLMVDFCAVANELSRRTGLSERTRFQSGNALELPFDDGAFDCVWTIQVQMNIADKPRFYGEIARVLRSGGRLVFQDICAGNLQPLDFPTPWATTQDQSHLLTSDALCEVIEETGLRRQQFRDVTAEIIAWQQANVPAPGSALPALGMHLVMGPLHAEKRANSGRALRDGRMVYVQGSFEKPA